MKRFGLLIAALAVALTTACTRVETGEVGLRIGFDKQVAAGELLPGSLNQTLIGEVITFPVREIAIQVNNRKPITADNSVLADFDFVAIYSINPTSVNELWTQKSRSFHAFDKDHSDWVLMYNYLETVANSAAFKAVRQYTALEVNDKRLQIEQDIVKAMTDALTHEKLNGSISINQVQVKVAQLDPQIIASANGVIRAQNEQKAKAVEVQTAKLEADRIAALNANSKAIEYMNAQATYMLAEAVKDGKVHAIVVPFDFKGIVNIGK